MSYTAAAVAGVLAVLALELLVLRTGLLRRRLFWASYAVVVSFQLLVNGVLTCREVVTYDESRILGPRIACAPVEDLLFGFAMVTLTLLTWVRLGQPRRGAADPRPPG